MCKNYGCFLKPIPGANDAASKKMNRERHRRLNDHLEHPGHQWCIKHDGKDFNLDINRRAAEIVVTAAVYSILNLEATFRLFCIDLNCQAEIVTRVFITDSIDYEVFLFNLSFYLLTCLFVLLLPSLGNDAFNDNTYA